jgi:hypothetical protein
MTLLKKSHGAKSRDKARFLIWNLTWRMNMEPSLEGLSSSNNRMTFRKVCLNSKHMQLTDPVHSGSWLGGTLNFMALPFIWNTPSPFPATSGCLVQSTKREVSMNGSVSFDRKRLVKFCMYAVSWPGIISKIFLLVTIGENYLPIYVNHMRDCFMRISLFFEYDMRICLFLRIWGIC